MMNPFKMLGDVNAMRKQAAAIQQALAQEEIIGRSGDVEVVMDGNQNVKKVTRGGEEEINVKNAVNDAIKRSQQVAAGKLAELTKDMQ